MRAVLFLLALAAAGCGTVCPSGTDERSDPEGRECISDNECEVRCACEADDGNEVEVLVSECRGDTCVGAVELCENGCGTMPFVAYCRPPD